MAKVKNIVVENAKIIFRNFAGKGDRFNPQGRRNFGVLIDADAAEELAEEGWHIKYLKAREEGEQPQAYLPVRVSYAVTPPAVYMVTKKKKTLLSEENVSTLDNADIENADLVISPYFWTMPGKNGEESGITAYLKTGYFTIVEDAFYDKYSKYDDPIVPPVDTDDIEIPFS